MPRLSEVEDDIFIREDEIEGLVSSPASPSQNSGVTLARSQAPIRSLRPSTPSNGASRVLKGSCKKRRTTVFWIAMLVSLALGIVFYVNKSDSIDSIKNEVNNFTDNIGGSKENDSGVTDNLDIDDGTDSEPDDQGDDQVEEVVNDQDKESDNGVDENDNKDVYKGTDENETKNQNDEKVDETDDETDDNDTDDRESVILTAEEEEEKKEKLIDTWGKWHFWDGSPESRPKEDYLSMYPNKDCPYEGFPDESWQTDAVYVNHMIDSAMELNERAKEAIFTEYGFGPRAEIDSKKVSARMKMFRVAVIDLAADDVTEKIDTALTRGGFTTKKSFHGMSRRILHAMMTNDDFTVVMAGDSSAAGGGNHFAQSYMLQFDSIMKPILERMGVKLVTRNLANGDVGTMSNALGSGSIYGDNVDMIIWDSDLNNGVDDEASVDLFFRQALLSGNRPPVLVGTPDTISILKDLHDNADADILILGSGMVSIPQTENKEQAKTLPQPTRYLNCTDAAQELCDEHKYNARCWINRDDVKPPTKQRNKPRHQIRKNPGFRQHQLKGRVLTFAIMEMLADALGQWGEITIMAGHPLEGEHWHLTDHYENIRSKVKSLDTNIGSCPNLKEYMSERVCSTPLKGRTEFTPRANPDSSSILSILKPAPDGFLPSLKETMLYEGVDVPNPSLMLPIDEIDVLSIVMNRRRELFGWQKESDYKFQGAEDTNIDETPDIPKRIHLRRRMSDGAIVPGKGWELDSLPGTCDGSATAICGREPSSDCLLYGHMNNEGGLIGNESSGWLVMNLSNVTEGIIMFKFETESSDLTFDYAINNEVVSLNKAQFADKRKAPQDEVELMTLLDDPGFVTGDEAMDVEFAIHVKNCGNDCKFKLTHVYWA